MASRIEDYALIGDCRSAALVSRGGSIDWLCWPRFDSAACFAALLGTEEHGHWTIAPVDESFSVTRAYVEDTLVLSTIFRTSDGAVELLDFLVHGASEPTLVRILRGVEGTVEIHSELVIRFDFGLTVPWVTRTEQHERLAIAGPMKLVLRTPARVVGCDMKSHSRMVVKAGQEIPFVLQCLSSVAPIPPARDAAADLDATVRYWRGWAHRCAGGNPWHETVRRSLLTLKALTYEETAGIVAAPTTSLPEFIGGVRNWDYRYCWLRDSSFTLQALMVAGYYDEAIAWRDWLVRAVAGAPEQVQIMYGVGGERWLNERELAWLPGYENSAPVRIGNAASTQLQLDVFGEVLDALYRTAAHNDSEQAQRRARRPPTLRVGLALLAHLEKIWRKPDEGIWEVRGPPRHFVHSKIMAWVAFDRAIRGLEHAAGDFPIAHWRKLRDAIHSDICERGFDQQVGAFMQYYGADTLDASVLLAPIVGFLPVDDPRIAGTIAAVEKRLLRQDFILRYEQPDADVDGLPPGEGAFLACSFWYVDVLVLQGRLDEAKAMFERLVGLANDVGLLAEEYDPRAKRMLGNFPQAFSHVALVNASFSLARALGVPAGHPTAPAHPVPAVSK
jgi:GH15 family glucan-1,4-alpha-glucosidase